MIEHLRTFLPHLFLIGLAIAPLIWLAQGDSPVSSFDRLSMTHTITIALVDRVS